MQLLLEDLYKLYGNKSFILACGGDTKIQPKEVIIKEDLTVWHNGACIINGMKDILFHHGEDKKEMEKLHKFKTKPKKKL